MNVFLARQPILDVKHNIRAYEIFYRSGFTNHYTGIDPDQATSKVIINTFQDLGLESLTSGNPAFINFSSTLLEMNIATLFPSKYLVVELLETVVENEYVLEKCKDLKNRGYTLALDDFVYTSQSEPFLDVADIVKIDFITTERRQLEDWLPALKQRNLTLLAEKVETWDELQSAKNLGFTMFQGYYFSRPEIVTVKRLLPLQLTCFELINQVNQNEIDLDLLTATISKDLALTYSLLRLVNSAAFFRRHTIESVKQALVLLGEIEIKKWVTLIALQEMSMTNLGAPVVTSLVRGRFAELLAKKTRFKDKSGTLFLAGLFSMLDALLQRPLQLILEEIKAPIEIQELLLKGRGPYQDVGKLILAYEQGKWEDVELHARKLELESAAVCEAYLEALNWCPAC